MKPYLTLRASHSPSSKHGYQWTVTVRHDDFEEGVRLKKQYPVLDSPHCGRGATLQQAISDLMQRLYDYGQGFTFTTTEG